MNRSYAIAVVFAGGGGGDGVLRWRNPPNTQIRKRTTPVRIMAAIIMIISVFHRAEHAYSDAYSHVKEI
jgi:hypothetical protein